ncbi:MAG: ABC transporter permease [Chloroflexi bacterium]|nr:ABC transporter permease [Chloroflexota bacterium]
MRETLVRLMAFFSKEFNEIRRQPRLVLSLLLGPLVILLLVGLGYQGQRPVPRVALVVPPNVNENSLVEQFVSTLEQSFTVVNVGEDPRVARDMLVAGDVELVQIIPAYAEERLEENAPLSIRFIYDEVNPQEVQYMQWTSGQEAKALNDYILIDSIEAMRADLDTIASDIDSAQQTLNALEEGTADLGEAQRDIQAARSLLELLTLTNLEEEEEQQINELITQLRELETALEEGQETFESGEIAAIRERMSQVAGFAEDFNETPTSNIVAPITIEHQNLAGESLSLVTFFAPAVAVFILQHIAVTLGALSLVRERMHGTREFYAAAPMSTLQVLVGKYTAYLLFTGVVAAGLAVLLVTVLNVPFGGNVLYFAAYIALFLLASLGIGFLISTISPTDIQAVQLSMLILLLSVFFSGFVIPLNYYVPPIQYTGYILPVTHAIESTQSILFRSEVPGLLPWAATAAIAAATLTIVVIIWQRQFRRVSW